MLVGWHASSGWQAPTDNTHFTHPHPHPPPPPSPPHAHIPSAQFWSTHSSQIPPSGTPPRAPNTNFRPYAQYTMVTMILNYNKIKSNPFNEVWIFTNNTFKRSNCTRVLKDLRWFIRHHSSVVESAALKKFSNSRCDAGRKHVKLDSHGFEHIDPQSRVLNYCFQ